MEEKQISSVVGADANNTPTNSEPANSGAGEEQNRNPEQNKENEVERKYKNWIPPDRFQEVIEQKKELERKLKEIEEKQMLEKEQFKELYEKTKQELETYKKLEEKVSKYESIVKDLAERELNSIKEVVGEDKWQEMLELFNLEDKEPIELLEFLPKIKKFFEGITNKQEVSGGQPIPQKQITDEEQELKQLKEKAIKGILTFQERKRYFELLRKFR